MLGTGPDHVAKKLYVKKFTMLLNWSEGCDQDALLILPDGLCCCRSSGEGGAHTGGGVRGTPECVCVCVCGALASLWMASHVEVYSLTMVCKKHSLSLSLSIVFSLSLYSLYGHCMTTSLMVHSAQSLKSEGTLIKTCASVLAAHW